MKLSTSRSSILTAIVVATILAAVPGQIQRLLNTGEPYLFSHLFFEDMLARLSGPGRLRFIVQPAIAIFLGLRDGARETSHCVIVRPLFEVKLLGIARHGDRYAIAPGDPRR